MTSNTGYSYTIYSQDGLTVGTQYTFRVSAINLVGTGNPSNEASATPKSSSQAGPPAAPTNFAAKPIATNAINMTWTAPLDNGGLEISGYKISQKVSATGSSTIFQTLIADTKNTKTWYVHQNLAEGTTHTYKVTALNSAGEGIPSNEASATTFSSSGTTQEICGNGIDDNHNGLIDEGCTQTQEICGNGIDDDHDGLIDEGCTTTPTTQPSIGRLKVQSTDFAVRYEISGGKVSTAAIDVDTNVLSIKIKSTADGELTVTLPRELIDAKKDNGKDDVFFVLVDDEETEFSQKVTSSSRTLGITFQKGTTDITIYGTQSVPEFPIAALILVTSIAVTLIISTKWNKIPSIPR